MKRSLTTIGLGVLAAIGLAAGLATAALSADPGPPNQGDPDKVFTVASGYTCTGTITWTDKVEGGLGRVIEVTSSTPIVKVTIKSGSQAVLVDADWSADYRWGRIEVSQDVSNYVVWSCSGGTTTTTGTTPTTTETTPTTTETTPTTTTTQTTETTPVTTTTDTTPTTTETTPTATETTPLVPLTPPALPTKPEGASAPAEKRAVPTRPAAPLTPPAAPAAQAQPALAYTP